MKEWNISSNKSAVLMVLKIICWENYDRQQQTIPHYYKNLINLYETCTYMCLHTLSNSTVGKKTRQNMNSSLWMVKENKLGKLSQVKLRFSEKAYKSFKKSSSWPWHLLGNVKTKWEILWPSKNRSTLVLQRKAFGPKFINQWPGHACSAPYT